MPITKGFRQLVDEANAQITTYSVAQVLARLQDPTVQLVDIRDMRELERSQAGRLAGARSPLILTLGRTKCPSTTAFTASNTSCLPYSPST